MAVEVRSWETKVSTVAGIVPITDVYLFINTESYRLAKISLYSICEQL